MLASGLLLGLMVGPAAANSGGLAQAKRNLLGRPDLPSGWSGQGAVTTSHGGGTNTFPGASQLVACLGLSSSVFNLNAPSATSPTFQNKAGTDFVQDSVSAFPSTKVANQQYTAVANPKVPGCMTTVLQGPAKQQLTSSLGAGMTLGTVTVTPANPSGLIAHATGFTISFPVATQGITVNAAITIVSMVRGLSGNQITLTSVGLPFPSALQRHLETVAYARIG